ncbi:S-layer homology domain-containing protein [Sporosarcina sp. G11-34]|uniref:S-layer homology domain-containing protein n=1 Tax=Sporosarcina sp. G11-34 TaxID=2849605 RepID=UPI0022A9B103|nr:S-layer homology domain-containing protein [Sporosarcina sp. G11-34]MCZ2257595.1 S-layer homology domain-containing protein [Sporosarcina sp. G11-34]
MQKVSSGFIVFLSFILFSFHVSAQALTDISDHWAKEEIEALVEKEVIYGFKDDTFQPDAAVTRGQFLAYIVRALELPEGTSAFKDVSPSSSLYKDIAAAKKAGLIFGTAEGLALASEPVTRADVAVMLDRAMQLKGNYSSSTPILFKDAVSIGKYAYESVERMTHYGLIYGRSNNTFEPQAVATRGEAAVFINRMLKKLDEPIVEEDIEIPKPIDNQEVIIPIDNQQYVKVRMDTKGVPLNYDKRTTTTHMLSTDYHYYYHIGYTASPLGSLRVTLRKLDNGDTFVFTKFIYNGDNVYRASVTLPFHKATDYSLTKYESFGKVNQAHNGTFGVDKTSHPTGILSVKNGSRITNEVMMGKNYISHHRQQNYSGGSSVLRELFEERESYSINTDAKKNIVTATMNVSIQPKAISESWALLSKEQLFASTANRDTWFKRTIAEYSSINNWLTADGAYTKLPWSIEPGYKMGYGRNIGRLQGGIYLTMYNGNKERYYRNLVVNSIADLDVLSNGAITAGKTPIFKTEYTSTWLKTPYGLTAPYVDTRMNENAALFLKNVSKSLSIDQLKNANLSYADLLVSQGELGNVIRVTPSSHLIPDYFGLGNQKTKTHVSLNHALGEMRFLLETYKQTGDEKYAKTARQLKAAIEYLHPRWIRSNGDLWYQVNPDLTFAGGDYDNLTLMDLLLSQNIFAETGIPRSAIFDEMIRSKTKYLVKENKSMTSPIIKLLQDQGFGNLLNRTYTANLKTESNEEHSEELPKSTLELLAE